MIETNEPQKPSSTLRIDAQDIEGSQPRRSRWRDVLGRSVVALVLFGALLGQFGSSFGSTESHRTPDAAAPAGASATTAPAPTTTPLPTSCWSTHDIISALDPPPCTCTRS